MATVGEKPFAATAPQRAQDRQNPRAGSSGVMRCLAVSTSSNRRSAWRIAAEQQAWEALICRDAGEFMRTVHKQRAPLLIVDLPKDVESLEYEELVAAGSSVRQLSDALVAVCGRAETPREEIWARSLGVWTYFSGIDAQDGMALLLREARVALEQLARRNGRLPGGLPQS